jgi:hypothetical protein
MIKSLDEFTEELKQINSDVAKYIEWHNRLNEIVLTMDIPKYRREDILWLDRNIHFRNSQHKDFKEARQIIKSLIKLRKSK